MSDTPTNPVPPADPPENQGGGTSSELNPDPTTSTVEVAADPPDNQGGG